MTTLYLWAQREQQIHKGSIAPQKGLFRLHESQEQRPCGRAPKFQAYCSLLSSSSSSKLALTIELCLASDSQWYTCVCFLVLGLKVCVTMTATPFNIYIHIRTYICIHYILSCVGVWAHVHVRMNTHTCTEIICSLFSPCGAQKIKLRLDSKYHYPLSHLAGLRFCFLNSSRFVSVSKMGCSCLHRGWVLWYLPGPPHSACHAANM